MTNSIASAKCPSSVLTSGNYGMSQNRYTDDSKEYIFVKLTDSAYRAIEEYQRNANGRRFIHGQCAKIKFVGNSGIIHFPAANNNTDANNIDNNNGSSNKNSNAGRQFGFAIDEIEGSLECIQQKQHELDVLGSLSYRMRIHANEDVYDTTRTKMAIAEETEKSKCIREIKPNQTDIGRKVKKQPLTFNHHHNQQQQQQQQHGNSIGGGNNQNHNNSNNSSSSSNFSNSFNRLKGSSPSNGGSSSNNNNSNSIMGNGGGVKMGATSSIQRSSPNPTMLGGSGTIGGSAVSSRYGGVNNNSHSNSGSLNSMNGGGNSLTTASSLSSTLAGGIANGYASASLSSMESTNSSKRLKLGGSPSSSSRGAGNIDNLIGPKSLFGNNTSGGTGGGKGSNSSNSKLPDISRRKIRERLIHLLALKPFKKPELYARLQNEGLRERERPLISNILKDISTMSRDNTYNLRRQMWNDVNENWPYYTEQELQLLKRRKPQNLTPPLSSDAGSSTSGQSPTSTHTGSPPPIVGMLSMAESSKSLKRNSLDYDDALLSSVQVKKQRISHYRKDTPSSVGGNSGSATSSGSGGASYGNTRMNFGSNILAKGSMSSTSYSPSRQTVLHAANSEDSYGNVGGDADLSYNILDNADDFMSHLERNDGFHGSNNNNNSRKPYNSSNSSTHKTSSPRNERNDRTDSRDKFRKSYASSSGNSPSTTAYGSNFVPENKSSSSSSSTQLSGSRSNNLNNGYFQRQSPNYAQQQSHNKNHASGSNANNNNTNVKSTNSATNNNNSAMYSSRTSSVSNVSAASSSSPRDDTALPSQHRGIGSSGTNSGNSNRFQNKNNRTPTPPMRGHHRQHVEHSTTTSQNEQQQQQQFPFASHQQQLSQQPPQQQQHSSPTQQIADAASAYASAYTSTSSPTEKPCYDFSNYTPITTIEQRRKYKTEFESDYDEYLKLLKQIEGVGRRFRSLAARLENARKGCPEFNDIKQQIVSEYERIRNAETLKRDKQRFDYLHEKLAYIKQLVTDYDKTLTSGGANGSSGSNNNNNNSGGNNGTSTTVATTSSLTSLMPSPKQQQHDPTANSVQQLQYNQQRQQQQQQHHDYQHEVKQQLQRAQQQQQSQLITTSPLHHHYNDAVEEQFSQQQQRHTLTNDLMRTHHAMANDESNKNYHLHHQQQHLTITAPPMYGNHHVNKAKPQTNIKNDTDDSDGTSDSNDDDDDEADDEVIANVLQDDDEDDDDDDSYSNNSNEDDDHNNELD